MSDINFMGVVANEMLEKYLGGKIALENIPEELGVAFNLLVMADALAVGESPVKNLYIQMQALKMWNTYKAEKRREAGIGDDQAAPTN